MNEEINKALKTIKEGGLILYPTDTVWGIGCDAGNDKAMVAMVFWNSTLILRKFQLRQTSRISISRSISPRAESTRLIR